MDHLPADPAGLHPFVRRMVADKIRGVVIGSALGDTIGLYTEFLDQSMSKAAYPQGTFSLVGEVTRFCSDSHRNRFIEGSWTDDTDHSLLILLSYLHGDGKELSSLDFARRLKLWIEQGLRCLERLPLGLGRTTGSILVKDNYLSDPKAAAFRSWRNSNFKAAPNGSLMRTHPLGVICWNRTRHETFEVAADFCLVTHADSRCVVSCCIATALVRGMLRGEIQTEKDIDALVDAAADYTESIAQQVPDSVESVDSADTSDIASLPPVFDREELLKHTRAGSFEDLQLDDLRKQGYVYKCLGAGIISLRHTMRRVLESQKAHVTVLPLYTVFEEIISELTMQGGDADTNATVAGAFLGCLLGFSLLPPHWYNGMRDVDWLLTKTDALIHVMNVDECALGYKGSEDPDTKEDGGKGLLNREELEKREKAFMAVYLKKTVGDKLQLPSKKQAGGAGSVQQGLARRWKDMFTSQA